MKKAISVIAVLILLMLGSGCSRAGREPETVILEQEFEKLKTEFRSPSEDTYGETVTKLNKSPGQAVPFYEGVAIKDPDAAMRRRAVIGLGMTKDKRAVEPLIRILKDPDISVAMLAARYLGKLGDKRAVGPLIETLRSKNSGQRLWSANALKAITGEDFDDDYTKWKTWYEKNK